MEAVARKGSTADFPSVGEKPGCGRLVAHWKHRIRHWWGMFAGTSYYHQSQGLGLRFVPGSLEGYFNDMTGKTRWEGAVDAEGLPISKLSNGTRTYFPILLCQKALGHWDTWLAGQEEEHRRKFLGIAHWLLRTQDEQGGWDTWTALGAPVRHRYSAMTQGEAISVMARAFKMTGERGFERACGRAMLLMRQDVKDGGVCWFEGKDLFLEEFPGSARDTVLNGWVFAWFGIYDYLLAFSDQSFSAFFSDCQRTLLQNLEEFDAGFWSYYSDGTRRLASPFYHRLHLSQLEALARILPEGLALRRIQERWAAYERNRAFKYWAITRKAVQKLSEPREIAIVG